VPGAPIARPLVGIVMGGLSEHTSVKTAVMRSKWEPVRRPDHDPVLRRPQARIMQIPGSN
jgi:hypothetical protein